MQVRRGGFTTLAVVLAVGLAAPGTTRAQNFFFKDGDTIVVMGDSITEQHLYSNYLEMWSVSRFPAWKLTFRNVGIGGDTSGGGNSRFKRDVLAYKPTVLTVDFGMNDGGYQPFNPGRFDNYMKGHQGIADQARKAGIRVAWMTPQPVEHDPGNKGESYNQTLEKFSEGVKEIADKNGGLFVDQFHPYWAVIEKARKKGEKGRITGGDAVHPGPPGQALMAAAILKGLRFPRLVSTAAITIKGDDAKARGINCSISDIEVKNGVRFKRLDRALPYFPAAAKSILKWAPLLADTNDYGLHVKGLKEGHYEIRVGGKKVAAHSSKELAAGVNLAQAVLATGPVAEQVEKVWKAVEEKNRYFHDRVFRGVVLANPKSLKGQDPAEVYAERMKKMPELDAAVRAALAMEPHQVDIVAVKE
jgi:lysophospholipase L1-like esterase